MKKTRWLTVGMLALCALMGFTACGKRGGNSGGGNNGGNGGNEGDSYVDYDPSKPSGGDSFDYDGNYSTPELNIDGKGDDEQWQSTPVLVTYGKNNAVTVKVYRGQEALFFLFDVKDTVLLTQGVTNDDAVTHGDSIELYLDTKADGGRAPQSDDFQINLGIHGKTRIMQGSGSNWGSWNGLIDYEVDLNGTLNDGDEPNDVGYTVEVMVRYRDIMIEKDDTIGVAFGQVDKWQTKDAPAGNPTEGPWSWYGWTYKGIFVEPQTIDNYILLDKDNNLITRDEQAKPDVTIAGTVKDTEGNPVAGATATIEVDGSNKTATTDGNGYFAIADVPSNYSYSVTVEKSGYLTASVNYTRDELRASNGGIVLKEFTLASQASLKYTTVTGTVKNVANGAVGGATVSVKNTTLTTTAGADGTFTIADVPANNGNITLVTSKTGYAESETIVTEATLVADGTTSLGDININLPWANMGMFAGKSNFFVAASTTLTRTLTGIQMHFEGLHRLSGHIEAYVDTKESGTVRDNDSTAWCFNLNDDGTVTGAHYQNTFTSEGLVWTIVHNDSDGFVGDFYIPYSYLGIGALEVFGIEFGQWSTSAKDWDGWTNCPVGTAPVAENPTTWVRVGATNNLYRATNNDKKVTLSGTTQAGVTVSANGVTVTASGNGAWSMEIPYSANAITVTYTKYGYLTHKETIEAGYFDTHFSWSKSVTLEKKLITITGEVTDNSEQHTTLKDVTVTVLIGGEEFKSGTTGDSGIYTIEGVPTDAPITLRFEKDGYGVSTKQYSLDDLAAVDETALTLEYSASLISEDNTSHVTLKGQVTNVNGNVAGAIVTVQGTELTATTNADGSFSIANFPAVECTIIIEKDGYLTLTIEFTSEMVNSARDGEDFDLNELDMPLAYAQLQGLIADKNDDFAKFKGSFTRSAVGFEFHFEGTNAFAGRIELFVDTKTSAGDNQRDTTDYLFNLNADGTIAIVNWGEGEKNEAVPQNMKLTVKNADSKPVVDFTLPYAFFGQKNSAMAVEPTEVIGISAGQWSTKANDGGGDWDGWDNFALPGANGAPFVKPEMPQDYIRLGAHNEVYSKADNETIADLHTYEIRFATGENTDSPAGSRPVAAADYFYAKVSGRDSEGVTFSFLTTGNFDKEGEQVEFILIYFDTGATVNGWNNVDYLLKIASDGTVYGSNGTDNNGNPTKPGTPDEGGASWWSATDDFKLGFTATVNKNNGVTTVEVKVPYTVLNIGATDVFGIAMREASHNAGDHHLYDPWYDCYYGGNRIDAANSSQYIRVKADGTLTTANSNAAVS